MKDLRQAVTAVTNIVVLKGRRMIYFIQDSGSLLIKIGFTQGESSKRLKELQTGNSSQLVLLTTMRGDKETESHLHDLFASARERGEWFRPVPELIRFVLTAGKTLSGPSLSPGFVVNLTIREGAAPCRCYLGKIQDVDEYGIRITLADILGFCGYDLFVPWSNIESSLVSTPQHDPQGFYEQGEAWYRYMEKMSKGATT